MIRNVFALILALVMTGVCSAQLRVVTYNTTGGPRPGVGTVLKAIGDEIVGGLARPVDILFLQEQRLLSTTTQDVADLLNTLYETNVYTRGYRVGKSIGGTGRPGVVYRSDVVELLGEQAIGQASSEGGPRETLRYDFSLIGYDGATFTAYNSHYKASTGPENRGRRLVEAEAIRANSDELPEGTHIIYAGDFNVYGSSEPMYQHLLSEGPGQAFDPIDSPGEWSNSEALKNIHTKSPNVMFNGLKTGGMDDRFDFQLVSGKLLDGEGLSFLEGSYRTFGNNGTHTINSDIQTGNGAGADVLEALSVSSDHLPVVVDYQTPAVMQVSLAPVPPIIAQGSEWSASLTVANDAAAIGGDELDYELNVEQFTVAPGSLREHSLLLNTSHLGDQQVAVDVTATSEFAANPSFSGSILYRVAVPGDANLEDGFGSADLVQVFQFGTYETDLAADWTAGDWDGNHRFNSSDLVLAFAFGRYEAPALTVPEPSACQLLSVVLVFWYWRSSKANRVS